MPATGQMTYEDLIRWLRDRRAMIVHFSHHANTRAGGVFPADLHASALNSRLWPLSCSLVWPKHTMSLVGSVGLVLRPRSLASIVGVLASDAAYSTSLDKTELGAGEPLNEASLDRSMRVAIGDYNEWRVRESDVVGVYFEAGDHGLLAKKHVVVVDDTGQSGEQTIAFQPITVDEVHECFPDLPVYTRFDGRITASSIPASVVYPWDLTGA